MKSYSGSAFNAGLFSLLGAVLKPAAPGYSQFLHGAKDAWQELGLDPAAIDEALFESSELSAEKRRAAVQDDMPLLVERSFGSEGRALYELGFAYGTYMMSLMAKLDSEEQDSFRNLKYKCAAAKNPKNIHGRILEFEKLYESGNKPSFSLVAKGAENAYLDIVASVVMLPKRSIVDVILDIALEEVPYVGKPLKRFYKHIRKSGED